MKVLQHVATHRLTTEAALRQTGILETVNRDVVKKRLQRLRDGGYLDSDGLFQQRVYYHLTQQAAKLLGEDVRKDMWLGQSPKVRAYGGLLFCTDPQTHCYKQSASEFREKFPQLWKSGMRLDYYINASDPDHARLGFYRVDYVPNSPNWESLVKYIREYISDRCGVKDENERHPWRDFIYKGLFEITVITTSTHKAEKLEEAFAKAEDMPTEIHMQFYVASDLIPLIAPEPK